MATYKKQLKDQNGDNIIPALGTATVTSTNIDWSTMPGSYSTTEQKTPFTWIDGKPIYKKTIDLGNLPNANVKTVNHGVSFARIIRMEAFALDNNGIATPLPFPGTAGNPNGFIQIALTATAFSIGCGQDRSNNTAYATIWYTKTTD